MSIWKHLVMFLSIWLIALAAVGAKAQNVSRPVIFETQDEPFYSPQEFDVEALVKSSEGRAYKAAGSCSKSSYQTYLSSGDYSVITSPNYPNEYPNSNLCGWWFYTSSDYYLKFTCDPVGIYAFDTLFVYDKNYAFKTRWTDTWSPFSYTFYTNDIMIAFNSDWLQGSKGFRCVVTTAPWPCTCGISKSGGRIEEGTEVPPLEYPWAVALVISNQPPVDFRCGGSLISKEWILSSARCKNDGVAFAILGVHDLATVTSSDQYSDIISTIVHPDFDAISAFADIALFKIATIRLGATAARPICLPQPTSVLGDLTGYNATALGWGVADYGFSSVLLKMDLLIGATAICKNKYSDTAYQVGNKTFCSEPNEEIELCEGDWGGPLMIKNSTNYYLAAIVTVPSCSQSSYWSIFTQVSEYLDWIYANAADASFCSNA